MISRARALLVLITALVLFPQWANAETVPPAAVKPGWNLVSAPCEVSVADLRTKLGQPDIQIYAWNGAGYEAVDMLHRGHGYFLDADSEFDASTGCLGIEPVDEIALTLNQGWNLVGNPFYNDSAFEVLLKDAFGEVGNLIYYYSDGAIKSQPKNSPAATWQGYWVYMRQTAVVNLYMTPDRCDDFRVTHHDNEPEFFRKGDIIPVRARCAVTGAWYDVTAHSVWTSDNDKVAVPVPGASGRFDAVGGGAAELAGSFLEYMDSVDVAIVYTTSDIESVSITANIVELFSNESTPLKVIVKYRDGSKRQQTSVAAFEVQNPKIGSIRDAVFYPAATGATTVTATVMGISSEPLDLTVVDMESGELLLRISKNNIEIHETTILSAVMMTESGRTKGLSRYVQWHISHPDIITVMEGSGLVFPNALGTVSVYATYGEKRSNDVALTIGPKTVRWFRPFFIGSDYIRRLPCPKDPEYDDCFTHFSLKKGEKGRFDTQGFSDRFVEMSTGEVRVMSEFDYEYHSTDNSVLDVDRYGNIKALKEGLAGVRTYRDGIYSEYAWIYVNTDDTTDVLLLEFTNKQTIVKKGATIDIGVTLYTQKTGSYHKWFVSSNVTDKAEWFVDNPDIADVSGGVITGKAPGQTNVYAVYNGITSNAIPIRVWDDVNVNRCDSGDINDVLWSDGLSVASLETNCRKYSSQDEVQVRFLAEMPENNSRGVYDVCLDLYIYDSNNNLVRTFQNNKCSPTPLFRRHQGYTPVYDYEAQWDQKDHAGNSVPPGEYTAIARFYILYCPVMKLKFTIE